MQVSRGASPADGSCHSQSLSHAGPVVVRTGSSTKNPLLDGSRVAVAKEVMRLSRSADVIFAEQFEQAVDPDVMYHSNPVFAGSDDVGGADADLIIGDTLWELKSEPARIKTDP